MHLNVNYDSLLLGTFLLNHFTRTATDWPYKQIFYMMSHVCLDTTVNPDSKRFYHSCFLIRKITWLN